MIGPQLTYFFYHILIYARTLFSAIIRSPDRVDNGLTVESITVVGEGGDQVPKELLVPFATLAESADEISINPKEFYAWCD